MHIKKLEEILPILYIIDIIDIYYNFYIDMLCSGH